MNYKGDIDTELKRKRIISNKIKFKIISCDSIKPKYIFLYNLEHPELKNEITFRKSILKIGDILYFRGEQARFFTYYEFDYEKRPALIRANGEPMVSTKGSFREIGYDLFEIRNEFSREYFYLTNLR